jgi:hypothetical protein
MTGCQSILITECGKVETMLSSVQRTNWKELLVELVKIRMETSKDGIEYITNHHHTTSKTQQIHCFIPNPFYLYISFISFLKRLFSRHPHDWLTYMITPDLHHRPKKYNFLFSYILPLPWSRSWGSGPRSWHKSGLWVLTQTDIGVCWHAKVLPLVFKVMTMNWCLWGATKTMCAAKVDKGISSWQGGYRCDDSIGMGQLVAKS